MSLDHALLVSLLEKPSSGYELARRFDRSIGYFWHATHQQIYKVLARMEEAGWISRRGAGRRIRGADRKLFSVSAAGRNELARWLAEPTDPEGVRDALMVKLRGAAFGDAHALLPNSNTTARPMPTG
jgi:DNA-binding PadR family transcriptional regulator